MIGNKKLKLATELFILFIIVPVILAAPITLIFKLSIFIAAIIYVIATSIKNRYFSRQNLVSINFVKSISEIKLRILIVLISTFLLMIFIGLENLFIVIKKNPLMWVSISAFYSLFSVYPQEYIYRLFFFERYKVLFNNKALMLVTNALVFSIGHLMFYNGLVLIITFIGGILFATTYMKTKSLLFTTIEHALYGVWIFTLGMGEMLAFPMPE